MRVVSLVPSATESLVAWGVRPIAVSRFCEHDDIATVGGTKDPQVDVIVALAPDLVVMCDQENRREDAEAIQASGVAVHAIHITHIDHVAAEMARLSHALGLGTQKGAPVATTSDSRVPGATRRVRFRAWIPIWKRPWMTINGDTYASTLLSSAGIANVADDDAFRQDRYPMLDIDAARALQPDLVLAPSEPYPFGERHRTLLESVAPVAFVDGKDLFWWGTRTPSALDRLRSLTVPT